MSKNIFSMYKYIKTLLTKYFIKNSSKTFLLFYFNAAVNNLFNLKTHRYKKERKSFVIIVHSPIQVNLLKVS